MRYKPGFPLYWSFKRLLGIPVNLTVSGTNTVDTNAAESNYFRFTTTASTTVNPPINPSDTQVISYEILQSGGSGSVTFSSSTGGFAFGTDIQTYSQTSTNAKRDLVAARYNSTANKWFIVGVVQGY